jgi:hypothetical protein
MPGEDGTSDNSIAICVIVMILRKEVKNGIPKACNLGPEYCADRTMQAKQ